MTSKPVAKSPKSPKAAPQTRKRQRLTQEDRRAQLLKCAVKIFAEHGLNAANHALIAEDAGVSVPTVFFYFSSRESLVDAVLSDVERVHIINFKRALNSKKKANVVLRELGESMTSSLEEHRYHSRIFLEWSIMARADIWPRFLKLHQYIIQTLTKIIERGQREGTCHPKLVAEDEAYILHATAYNITQMKLTGCPPDRIERYINSVLRTVAVEES